MRDRAVPASHEISLPHRELVDGGITSPQGFLAGAVSAGIKAAKGLDLAVLFSQERCAAAGVFTTNRIKAAPVLLSQRHLARGRARAVIVNSGCANACVGEKGLLAAREMARLAGKKVGIDMEEVLVASTGVIGVPLPINRIQGAVDRLELSPKGGHLMAEAILTTDTRTKERALVVGAKGKEFRIGGIAKGAGMIHPNLATMLCFLTTDAAVEPGYLHQALKRAVDVSFNMITIDGDTSPNDTVLILANGMAGNEPVSHEGSPLLAEAFQSALEEVCIYLAKEIARDGEGATRLTEVLVEGAFTFSEARAVARTIASSLLVKAAVHGGDPNWGRIIAALGRSGVELAESKLDISLGKIMVMEKGHPLSFDKKLAAKEISGPEVLIKIDLGLGRGKATAWGCDLSEEYVTINSAYST